MAAATRFHLSGPANDQRDVDTPFVAKLLVAQTTGHAMIMGRNTFLSLPNGALPNRRHIVISDIKGESFEGCDMARSIDEALAMAGTTDECFVIGGGMIYAQFLPMAGKLYLTQVHQSFDADTFFPEIDFARWDALASETVEAGGKNQFAHTYTEYIRKI